MPEKFEWTWSLARPDDWEEFIEWYEKYRDEILHVMKDEKHRDEILRAMNEHS